MPRECPPARADLTVLELLFDSSAMVFVGRLLIVVTAVVLLAGAIFVLGSMAVRARRGHWLRRAGPFEVSDPPVDVVDRGTEAFENTIGEQRARIVELETVLSNSAEALAQADRRDS